MMFGSAEQTLLEFHRCLGKKLSTGSYELFNLLYFTNLANFSQMIPITWVFPFVSNLIEII